MPLRKPKVEPKTLPTPDPFTGLPVHAPREGEGETIRVTDMNLFSDGRYDEVQRRCRERSRMSAALLNREIEQYAASMKSHPVKRLRLSRKKGALTIEDAAFLCGISERTWKRVEAGEPVSDLVFWAISVGLEARLDQVNPSHVKF